MPHTAANSPSISPPSSDLLAEANRCVACGLCLPRCPTYNKTKSEADSPRGRIALMRGVLEQRIPMNERFLQHMDLCLTCRACEQACPSKVEYGRLADGIRPLIAGTRGGAEPPGAGTANLLKVLVSSPARLRLGGLAMFFYRRLGIRTLAHRTGFLRRFSLARAEALMPSVAYPSPWETVYPAQGAPRGEVALFLGCVARLVDQETNRAAVFILNRLGYTVYVPRTQGCCGALHRHDGETEQARSLAEQNLLAFGDASGPVLSSASGCGAWLQEYHLVGGERGRAFAGRVMDISTFLSDAAGWDQGEIKPLPEKAVVHEPCTLRNVMGQHQAAYKLLARIPELRVEPLPGNGQCCGGAGLYPLRQPEMAETLRDDKMRVLRDAAPRYLLTSNIGCAMWLAEGVGQGNAGVEILHPVVLLARQMGYKST